MMERSKCMNIPKVRFHGFKEKWREESLSKLFVERHEISTITESLPQLSFTISEGVIYPDDRKSNKRDFLIKDILSKKYLITCVGDILYNPANVIYGAIHRNSLCDGVVSPIYKIFKTEQDSNFMECVVRNPSFISQLSMKTEGTVTKLKTLKPESFLEMIVKIAPSIYEQRKIASYFQTLDSLIQTTSKKLASLKQIKAASLQSMFPQEGETVPKVRFKGFEGKWKNLTLGEIGKWSKGRLLSKSDLTADGKNPCIHYGELFVNYSEVINEVESYTNVDNGCYSEIGDILFPDSDVTATGLARCSAIMQNGVILGGGINILKVDKKFYSPYISYSINQEKGQIISRVIGTTVRHINSTALSEVQIAVPSDIKEQQQIADYFTCLDKQITLQAQRLEKLKQIKAACLDKMFV